jgi:hypothetical protein
VSRRMMAYKIVQLPAEARIGATSYDYDEPLSQLKQLVIVADTGDFEASASINRATPRPTPRSSSKPRRCPNTRKSLAGFYQNETRGLRGFRPSWPSTSWRSLSV